MSKIRPTEVRTSVFLSRTQMGCIKVVERQDNCWQPVGNYHVKPPQPGKFCLFDLLL